MENEFLLRQVYSFILVWCQRRFLMSSNAVDQGLFKFTRCYHANNVVMELQEYISFQLMKIKARYNFFLNALYHNKSIFKWNGVVKQPNIYRPIMLIVDCFSYSTTTSNRNKFTYSFDFFPPPLKLFRRIYLCSVFVVDGADKPFTRIPSSIKFINDLRTRIFVSIHKKVETKPMQKSFKLKQNQ